MDRISGLSTPSDYFRSSDELPERKFVGILSCQRDPTLGYLDTIVLSSNKLNSEQIAARPSLSLGVSALWEVVLKDTVIFPEGGGQCSDEGALISKSDSGDHIHAKVVYAERRALDAIHIVENAEHLKPGDSVRVVVNHETRWDHMTQHTGQHLLSGMLEHLYNVPTLSWSLSANPLPCYVELPRKLEGSEINETIKRCNDLIRAGTNVYVDVSPLQHADERPRTMPSDYGNGTDTNKSDCEVKSDDKTTATSEDMWKCGVLRNICIEGLEINPCCGTHVSNLSQLQSIFILPSMTSVRGENARLYFLVGSRCIKNLSTSMESCRQIALAFGCSQNDISSRVNDTLESKASLTRRLRKLRETTAEYISIDLISSPSLLLTSNSQCKIHFWWGHGEEDNIEFLSLVSARTLAGIRENKLDSSICHIWILLGDADGSIIIAGSTANSNMTANDVQKLVQDSAQQLKQVIGKDALKGGGKDRWQGKRTHSSLWKEKEVDAYKVALCSLLS